MATYEDLFGEPVDVLHPKIKVFAVDDNDGLPIRQLSITLLPGEGLLELPRGRQGPTGAKGEPATPYAIKGDRTTAQIDALTLGVGEKGYAYRNTNTNALHYWSGTQWIVLNNAFGAQGPQGPAGDIANVSLAMIGSTETATAYLSGPEGNQTLNLEIPAIPGPQGPQGPAASITAAADYDATTAPKVGDFIGRKANGKWAPVSAPYMRFYSMPESGFQDTGDLNGGARTIIGQYPLDQLAYASFLVVEGHLYVGQGPLGTQAEVEVRVGDAANGTLIAKGHTNPGQGNQMVHIHPHFSTSGAPTVNTSPSAYRGQVVAGHTGNAGTVFVSLLRKSGLTTVRAFAADAQLLISRYPVG